MAYMLRTKGLEAFFSCVIGSPSPIYAGWRPWIHHTRPNKRTRTWILLYGFTCPETSWDGVCLMTWWGEGGPCWTPTVMALEQHSVWRESHLGYLIGVLWWKWCAKFLLAAAETSALCYHWVVHLWPSMYGFFSARQIWNFVSSLIVWCSFDVIYACCLPRT